MNRIRIRRRPAILSTVIAASLAGIVGSAASADLLASEKGWNRLDVPNRPAANFEFSSNGGDSGGLAVRTDKSVSFLYRTVHGPKPDSFKFLSWRWRQDGDFPHTDLSQKGTDDRPLAVHLWFSDPDSPPVFGALGWIFGFPHITHTITYVLGGRHPPGTVLTNPYYDNGAVIALRGDQVTSGLWYSEKRDIQWDIDTCFPSNPLMKILKFIAISADSDDTGGNSAARITDLRLSGAEDDSAK